MKRQDVGLRLAITRTIVGKEPAEFCRLYKIKLNTYSQWESGDRLINLDSACYLCEALGITLDWLYRGKLEGLPWAFAQRIREAQSPNVRPFPKKNFT